MGSCCSITVWWVFSFLILVWLMGKWRKRNNKKGFYLYMFFIFSLLHLLDKGLVRVFWSCLCFLGLFILVLLCCSYQLEALEMAIKKNTIVFLETGSGKTLIAIMLLRSFAYHLRKPLPFIAVFLVPQVVLVSQVCQLLTSSLSYCRHNHMYVVGICNCLCI